MSTFAPGQIASASSKSSAFTCSATNPAASTKSSPKCVLKFAARSGCPSKRLPQNSLTVASARWFARPRNISNLIPRSDAHMPITPHVEKHFTAGNFVRDVVIGMSDGLTVPFALAAGLSGAVQNTRLIVVGGLAEVAAGSIAMGLGGYLGARGDAEHSEREGWGEDGGIKEF